LRRKRRIILYQYIVFDLDMTILNTWEANLCAVKEALEKLEGKIVEKKDLEHFWLYNQSNYGKLWCER